MKIGNFLYVRTREVWRNWLSKNHRKKRECWIIFPRRQTGKPSISYEEAVEEALCFGWIDSNIQKIDGNTFGRRFSPRNPRSKWSALNKKRIGKLVREGRMTVAGTKKINFTGIRDDYGRTPAKKKKDLVVPAYFEAELKKHRAAHGNFRNLAPSYRRNYLLWIRAARTEPTRRKRIAESICLLAKNQKLGMK